MGCAVLASGCVVREVREPPPPVVYREPAPPPPPPVVYGPPPPPAPAPVVAQDPGWEAVSIEPPMEQPAPVAIPWAPPPMLWDPPPPRPWFDAVWVGGHWTWWNGEWVWARGHWARPPTVGWVYSEPYYEYRGDAVVFVAGFWRPQYRVFVPPPPTVYIQVVQVRVVHVGYVRPIGPHGVFVPPPPGSQPGVIVPCPVGTPPAVVLSAPPVVRPGMVVRPVSRGGVVEVVAPAGVTREGRPVNARAPVVAHDAASVHPVVVVPPPARNAGGPGRGVNEPASFPSRGPPATVSQPAPFPSRGPGRGVNEPAPFPSRGPPATVGGPPVATPVPAQPGTGTVSVRQPPPPQAGQPPVEPVLRPESMGDRGGPRPWSNGDDRTGNEGPILRPVPRPEGTPRPPPVQNAPAASRPSGPPVAAPAQSSAAETRPAAAPPASRRVEPAPGRPRAPQKVDPQEKKGHPDPRER